jgi:RimJ/RimL family protein N-acetyltransferase
MLQVHRYEDARTFLERAEPWLLGSEIKHTVLLQVARNARTNDAHHERPMYWATIENDGTIIGCAYRTPPYKVGVTALPPATIDPLITDLAAVYETVSGFSGPEPTVSAVAAAWVARRGGAYSHSIGPRQQLLSLPTTLPPQGKAGMLRLASRNDVPLAQSWGAAVSLDTGITLFDGALCAQLIGAKRLYFWVDDIPRCMIGLLHETPHSAGIGIVYTPAAYRRQGHATTALSALHELLLERGVPQSYLFIDPGNDAALALARKLGCSLVQEVVDIDWR